MHDQRCDRIGLPGAGEGGIVEGAGHDGVEERGGRRRITPPGVAGPPGRDARARPSARRAGQVQFVGHGTQLDVEAVGQRRITRQAPYDVGRALAQPVQRRIGHVGTGQAEFVQGGAHSGRVEVVGDRVVGQLESQASGQIAQFTGQGRVFGLGSGAVLGHGRPP